MVLLSRCGVIDEGIYCVSSCIPSLLFFSSLFPPSLMYPIKYNHIQRHKGTILMNAAAHVSPATEQGTTAVMRTDKLYWWEDCSAKC
jgi:hypothetical protein